MCKLHTAHTPHMRPGCSQDESSKHEHVKMHGRCHSDNSSAPDKRLCRSSNGRKQIVRRGGRPNRAGRDKLKRAGLLSIAKRQQLDNMVSTLFNYTVWMEEALVAAKESQFFAPEYIKNLAAVKDKLALVAAATKRYTENNKEQGTMDLKRNAIAQMDEATKEFAPFRKILELARRHKFEMKSSSVEV